MRFWFLVKDTVFHGVCTGLRGGFLLFVSGLLFLVSGFGAKGKSVSCFWARAKSVCCFLFLGACKVRFWFLVSG